MEVCKLAGAGPDSRGDGITLIPIFFVKKKERTKLYILTSICSMYLRLLIGILKGHDNPGFDNSDMDTTLEKFDKIIYWYYSSWVARHMLKDTFLRSPEYSHLAILPDDVIIPPESIDILLDDLSREDYPFLCGSANLDNTEEGKKTLTVSLNLTSPSLLRYDFIIEGSELYKKLLNSPQPIIVKHMGDPFPIIRRDIVNQLSFDNVASYNGVHDEYGCCEDVMMSYELDKLGIPIYCDLRARMNHLKISDEESIRTRMVGIKEAYIQFVPAI
jgi:hypothetical protein